MKKFFKIICLTFIISNMSFANTKHINYIMSINKNLDKTKAENLYKKFKKYTEENKVDIELALAVASVESGFRETAESGAGAYGIMQIMPITSEHYNKNRKNLDENIEIGVKHLKDSISTFGNTDNAIASYNAGISRIKSTNYKNIPETRYYVAKVKQELTKLGNNNIKVDRVKELETIVEVVKKKNKANIGFNLNENGNEKLQENNSEESIEGNSNVDEEQVTTDEKEKVEEVKEERKGLGFKLGGLGFMSETD